MKEIHSIGDTNAVIFSIHLAVLTLTAAMTSSKKTDFVRIHLVVISWKQYETSKDLIGRSDRKTKTKCHSDNVMLGNTDWLSYIDL